ncbi:hypothetical protein ANTPLA_LOCUS1688 [Anthophora plagiata]
MPYSWFIIIANHGPSAFDCPPALLVLTNATAVDTENVTGTRARSMYSQSAVFPRLAVIQSAKWKDRNGLWFGFGIIHYAAHNTPSPATAVLHTQSTCH